MDTELLRDIAPHYAVMVVLAYLILTVANEVVGQLSFWIELGVIILVFLVYRVVLTAAGYGPELWE